MNLEKPFIYGAGVEPSPILLRAFIGLLYQPWMIVGDDGEELVEGMNGKGIRITWRKPASVLKQFYIFVVARYLILPFPANAQCKIYP
jgi:hypothetical protein